jgi:hypothetical protein
MAPSPMPIIVGAPRSGTTLLRFILDAHPDLAIPPETGFLALAPSLAEWCGPDTRQRFLSTITSYPPEAPAWPDFGIPVDDYRRALDALDPFTVGDAFRAFYRQYAARFNKSRWGDKTPTYCLHMPAIARVLPEARFIHVIRDGRDVALSLRSMWFAPGQQMDTLARFWVNCISTARREAENIDVQYFEVRFEDLIRETSRIIEDICAFIDLDFSPQMLDYHAGVRDRLSEHRSRVRPDGTVVVSQRERLAQQALTLRPPQMDRVGSWRETMRSDEQDAFEAIAGPLLRELGYDDRTNVCSSVEFHERPPV